MSDTRARASATCFPSRSDPALSTLQPFITPAFNTSEANLSFTTTSACVGVVAAGNHHTTGGPGAAAVLLAAVRGVKLSANTCYWHGAPTPSGSRGAPTQCALIATGGNCSRFYATDVSFEANVEAFLYLDDGKSGHPIVSAGFWPVVDIVDSEIGSGSFTATSPIPYRGRSCNAFHTYVPTATHSTLAARSDQTVISAVQHTACSEITCCSNAILSSTHSTLAAARRDQTRLSSICATHCM